MLTLLAVFFCVVVLTYFLSLFAPRFELLAFPGEHRRHHRPTPMVGGISIFIGILFGLVVIDNSHQNILPSMLLLCAVGVLDDRFKLTSWVRIICQGVAAYMMIELTGVRLLSLGSLFSSEVIHLGTWSTPLTIFATIGVINAINMSDGLDGLAGLLTTLILTSILFISPELYNFSSISIAAIFGFLFWNLRIFRDRASVFMGDAGSTILGLIIAYLLIASSQEPFSYIQPVTALWLMALPLFDAVAVLLVRPVQGKSPFSADRIHYHHLIQNRGVNVNNTLLLALAVQCLLMLIGLWMLEYSVSDSNQLLAFLFCFVLYLAVVIVETKQKV